MTLRGLLAETLGVLSIESPSSYVWLGQRFDIGSAGVDGLARLRSELRARLYSDVFCTGGPAPAVEEPDGHPETASPPRGGALSSANCGRGSPMGGWVVRGRDGADLVLERDGLRVWAGPDEVMGGPHHPPGEEVVVSMPKESLGLPGGFYSAYGDAGQGAADGAPIDRFYWNVRAEGRAPLVGALTSRLNGAALPFRLKVLNDPDAVRCDAGVVYVPAAERARVARALAEVLAAIAPHLRAPTPAFTLPLAPGLAFAEDPVGEDSFGEHRCRLLADALVEAHELGVTGIADRARIVLRRWERERLSPDFPYLNPGSDPRSVLAPLVR